ncbi:MAG: UDP-N-acetylmuramate dehydrogenase [Oscillospiraceae bacterium]
MRITDTLIGDIRAALPALSLLEREPMSAHTSFRIGGAARAMALPASAEETAALLRLLYRAGVSPTVMGNGTNLLVSDSPLDIIVLKMGESMAYVSREGEILRAGAGIPLARLAQRALEAGLSGLEFASGIPGTLGGAISMNAGAYGGEMKDSVIETQYINADGELCLLRGAEQGFGYRHSAFSDTEAILTGGVLALRPDEPERIQSRMRELAEKRRSSQPLDLPSAGSTFKRPQGGFAAALIDEAGLKGFSIGGAQVSPKHAGFVVNRGGATFADVTALMEHIQSTVYARSGVLLEPEVKIIK